MTTSLATVTAYTNQCLDRHETSIMTSTVENNSSDSISQENTDIPAKLTMTATVDQETISHSIMAAPKDNDLLLPQVIPATETSAVDVVSPMNMEVAIHHRGQAEDSNQEAGYDGSCNNSACDDGSAEEAASVARQELPAIQEMNSKFTSYDNADPDQTSSDDIQTAETCLKFATSRVKVAKDAKNVAIQSFLNIKKMYERQKLALKQANSELEFAVKQEKEMKEFLSNLVKKNRPRRPDDLMATVSDIDDNNSSYSNCNCGNSNKRKRSSNNLLDEELDQQKTTECCNFSFLDGSCDNIMSGEEETPISEESNTNHQKNKRPKISSQKKPRRSYTHIREPTCSIYLRKNKWVLRINSCVYKGEAWERRYVSTYDSKDVAEIARTIVEDGLNIYGKTFDEVKKDAISIKKNAKKSNSNKNKNTNIHVLTSPATTTENSSTEIEITSSSTTNSGNIVMDEETIAFSSSSPLNNSMNQTFIPLDGTTSTTMEDAFMDNDLSCSINDNLNTSTIVNDGGDQLLDCINEEMLMLVKTPATTGTTTTKIIDNTKISSLPPLSLLEPETVVGAVTTPTSPATAVPTSELVKTGATTTSDDICKSTGNDKSTHNNDNKKEGDSSHCHFYERQQQRYPIGTRIRKSFDENDEENTTFFDGTIVSFDRENEYYLIRYDDGDEEEFDNDEIDDIVVEQAQEDKKVAV